MANEGITNWLRARRRNAIVISSLYFLFAITCGVLVPLPIFFALFHLGGQWLCIGGFVVMILIYMDCVHSRRDDMSFIPRWIAREILHAIPRLALDGAQHSVRVARLARMQIEPCANVLSYLAARESAVSRDELLRVFPDLDWPRLVSELHLFEGVLFLHRDVSRLSLTTALRLVLGRFVVKAQRVRVEIPRQEPEPEPVSVEEPETLSANEILGVPENASLAEIKAAYRSRVKECHPDRFAGLDERSRQLAEEWTKALNAAYDTLLSQNGGRSRSRE